MTFDRKVIEDAGYSLITPVIVLNGKKFASVEPAASGEVSAGSPILGCKPRRRPPTSDTEDRGAMSEQDSTGRRSPAPR